MLVGRNCEGQYFLINILAYSALESRFEPLTTQSQDNVYLSFAYLKLGSITGRFEPLTTQPQDHVIMLHDVFWSGFFIYYSAAFSPAL
jgi:hypothetical protein